MKKILISLVTVLVFAGVYGWADSPGAAPRSATVLFSGTIPTNGVTATVVTNTTRISGYIDGIWLDIAGTAGQTAVVSIATASTPGDIQATRTIYANTAYTSADDGYCAVRQQAKSAAGAAISGVYLPISLFSEYVYISVASHAVSPGTSVTFRAVLFTTP